MDKATLLFVIEADRILLIRKLRGLGAGKINGPGGRIEPGETPAQAAIRELREELCIESGPVHPAGLLSFQFTDGYSLHCHVFRTDSYRGTPTETDEAIPIWAGLDAIPYDAMWADDRIWIPHMLSGTPFAGRFIFDNDSMLWYDMRTSGTLQESDKVGESAAASKQEPSWKC